MTFIANTRKARNEIIAGIACVLFSASTACASILLLSMLISTVYAFWAVIGMPHGI